MQGGVCNGVYVLLDGLHLADCTLCNLACPDCTLCNIAGVLIDGFHVVHYARGCVLVEALQIDQRTMHAEPCHAC